MASANQSRTGFPWFRFHAKAINNIKLQKLPGDLFKFWVNCLCVVTETGRVELPPVDDLAFILRMSVESTTESLRELVRRSLLDETETGSLTPHDWQDWQSQSDSSTERVRQFRERQKEQDGKQPDPPSETPPKPKPETLPKQLPETADHVTETVTVTDRIEENRTEENRTEHTTAREANSSSLPLSDEPKRAANPVVPFPTNGTAPAPKLVPPQQSKQQQWGQGAAGSDSTRTQFATWLKTYTACGVPFNDTDVQDAEREWNRCSFEQQIQVSRWTKEYAEQDWREYHPLPANFLKTAIRDKPWTRTPAVPPKTKKQPDSEPPPKYSPVPPEARNYGLKTK